MLSCSAIHQEMSCKDGKVSIEIDAADIKKVSIKKTKDDLTITLKSGGLEI